MILQYKTKHCIFSSSTSITITITTVMDPNPNPNPNQSIPTTTSDPTVTASDDNFLLDSPYLHRLIHHLTRSSDTSSSTTTSRYHSPTSKSAIESIPLINITSDFLQTDPIILCAVCKDQFVVNDDAKQLPCKHMYHPDCILPWLVNHNSCPVCRFEMPREIGTGDVKVRRRSRSRVFRLEDVVDDDEVMLGIGFRNLRNQYMDSEIEAEMEEEIEGESMASSFTEIGQTVEVDVLPDSDRTRGIRNVSGWSNWSVNGAGVDGGENVSGWQNWNVNRRGVNSGWLDDVDDDGGIRNVPDWSNWSVNGVGVDGGENVSGWRNWNVNRQGVNSGWLDDVDDDDGGGGGHIRNVSGWRNWPVNGVGVDGGENVSGLRDWNVNRRGVNGGWLDDDDDIVML